MSYVHPEWLKHQQQRWLRHDAHRFEKPEPIQRKTYSERLIEQRQAEEEAEQEVFAAAEWEAFEREVLRLRREWAEIKFEYEWRRFSEKYDPNQPRVPKGDPKGGQWAKEGGGDAGKDDGNESLATEPAAMRRGPTDKRPALPLHLPLGTDSGTQTQRPRITIVNNAQTGKSIVDETTSNLVKTLEGVVNDLPAGSGSRYGTEVHVNFAKAVRSQDLRGIGRVGVEQTFPSAAHYGAEDSIRTDIVLRDDGGEPVAIYDVKTGGAYLSAKRVQELRTKTGAGPGVHVIEMHVLRGLSLKSVAARGIVSWTIVVRLWR